MEEIDELLMGVAVEDQLSAVGVETDLKHAARRTDELAFGNAVL